MSNKKDGKAEFLARVCLNNRITVPRLNAEYLGVTVGDIVRVAVHIEEKHDQ
jgi:hypothetical protein